MTAPNSPKIKSSLFRGQRDSWGWKVALVYDILMMILIVINLFCLAANAVLSSEFSTWLFSSIHLPELLAFYRSDLRPWVGITEGWFTTFLIIELCARWFIAVIFRHHQRWWFFPFIHWYEILAILPMFRFLRLFRAVAIAYNLHSHGYKVIPSSWYRRAEFYYNLVMEELTSRIVVTVLDGIKRQLSTSDSHHALIDQLVEQHRVLFAQALTDVLQQNLGHEMQLQRRDIAENVGQVVSRAIEDTPELTQLLRLIPIVGGRIEQQIQSIGQRLGENITQGLIEPFSHEKNQQKNLTYAMISDRISKVQIEDNPHVHALVESAVFATIEALRQQVKVKKWQQILEQHDQAKE